MHLVAAVGGDPELTHRLRGFRDGEQRFLIHPITPVALPALAEALRALDFAGALLLDPRLQAAAARDSERSSLDVRELGAADTLVLTPAGMVADQHLGRALGDVLRQRLWDPRGARAVVLGSDMPALAAARELASLGVAHLTLLGHDRPDAERLAARVPSPTTTVALASAEGGALALLERADIVVRSDPTADLPPELYGPHLALVDLVPGPLTAWRRRGLEVGALTVGARDVEAHRLHLGLTSVLGPGVALEALLSLLHEA